MFPPYLQQQIEELLRGIKLSDLPYHSLSEKYRGERNGAEKLLNSSQEALAYAVGRMPATFGAVANALKRVTEVFDFMPETMIDVGAGTGASGWVAQELFDLKNLVCLERESVMLALGEKLMHASENQVMRQALWQHFDLIKDELSEQADLVTASYLINELPLSEKEQALLKLWQATKQVLLIVEPGTPSAFAELLSLREFLIAQGAYVIAPCPHQKICPLENGNWCHFSARIARSRLHRQLKSAEMGYEDEKYCYIAFSRKVPNLSYQRVLSQPRISKTNVDLNLCQAAGEIQNQGISVRDKQNYKKAKKTDWGDIFS